MDVMDGIVKVKEAFLTQNLRLNRKSLMLKDSMTEGEGILGACYFLGGAGASF